MQERTIFVQLFFYPQNRLQMNPFSFFHRSITLFCLFLLLALPIWCVAQEGFPSFALPNRCYSQCIIPAVYESKQELILLKDASTRIEIVPAVYDTVDIVVTEEPAYTIYELQAPEFSVVKGQLRTCDSSEILRYVPPIFETVEETVLVKPASTVWHKTSANCFDTNGSECAVWCLHEVPAEYITTQKRLLKAPVRIERTVSPPRYITFRKTLVSKPASVTKREVEAKTRIVKKVVLKTPAQQKVVDVPAEYSTVHVQQKVAESRYDEWRQVICETNSKTIAYRALEKLHEKGYYKGKISNAIDREARSALEQFRKDYNLPNDLLYIMDFLTGDLYRSRF